MFSFDKNTILFFYKLIVITILLTFFSCGSTKYLPQDSYLLKKNKIKIKSSEISAPDIADFVQQKPNRYILGMPLYLNFRNLTYYKKKHKFLNWIGYYKLIAAIGEEPVILDTSLVNKTKKQFEMYLKNRGYYNAYISDSIAFEKRKATVYYFIKPNKAYYINKVKYSFKDASIKNIIYSDTANSYIKKDYRFDLKFLEKERNRITEQMNDSGYYFFSNQYIRYEIDSNLNSHKVNIKLIIDKNNGLTEETKKYSNSKFKKYKIKTISVVEGFDVQKYQKLKDKYLDTFDTVTIGNIKFYYNINSLVSPKILKKYIYLSVNKNYNLATVKETHKGLLRIGTYNNVNIKFYPDVDNQTLDCVIQLTPFASQSYTVELEGTNSSGNLGVAGNLQYNHKSIFSGGENFNLKFTGGVEAQTAVTDYTNQLIPFNATELGVETSIKFPVFLVPFYSDNFIRRKNPRTIISFSYNYQNRPDYKRTIVNGRYGYIWHSEKYFNHNFNLLSLSVINVPYKNPIFEEEVLNENIGLKRSFEDQLVAATNYITTYSNQKEKRNRNYFFVRYLIESSGGFLSLLNSGLSETERPYKLFGMQYSQYIKTDIDVRFYQSILSTKNTVVYRAFAGIGYAYGNAEVMPYDKQYYCGGANGLRAWQIRSLGPGSYYNPDEIHLYQTSDLKLEFNLEYRYKMFWVIEGALFTDAGNIWAINSLEKNKDARFSTTFYKQIAVDGGLGLRLDFNFFLIRFDYGWILRDPKEPEDKRWVVFKPGYKIFSSKFGTFNFSIGYPF